MTRNIAASLFGRGGITETGYAERAGQLEGWLIAALFLCNLAVSTVYPQK